MILDLFKLDGKVAVVTGANTGLGQGMAVALAEAGAKVVGVGRRSCAETKEKIEAFGGSFTGIGRFVNNRSSRYRTFRCIGRVRQSRYSGK